MVNVFDHQTVEIKDSYNFALNILHFSRIQRPETSQ